LPGAGNAVTAPILVGTDQREGLRETEAMLVDLLHTAGMLPGSSDRVAVSRLSGGHSHVTWLVDGDAGRPGGSQNRFVVKVAKKDGPLAPYDISHEVAFVRMARERGLPTPEVVLVSEVNPLDEPLFAMRFVAGDAPTPREIVAWLGTHPEVSPDQLAQALFATLATMKTIESEPSTPVSMAAHYGRYVDHAAVSLLRELEGVISLPPSISHVRGRLVEGAGLLGEAPLSLVHGDFRFGNLMLSADGTVAAILDWERAMWGHYLHDLAYLSLPSMRYHGRIAGLVEDDEALRLWKRQVGEAADEVALAYLRTVSIFTELCSCLRALCAYARGRGRISLLRILPIIARHEVDMLDSLQAWEI
jgi:aminoglycoside phosphotransferase (APT) family kinase protein